ncbi:MAG: hypothetical protein HY690_13740 [Chloroflexi bacterium]|nr:hypothetical protein [Chloroflexota bacterium]
MERSEGFKATIGWIKPGTVDRESQSFFRMAPPDVNLAIYGSNWSLKMLHSGSFDAEAFDAQRERILESVRELLTYQDVDFVAVSGDLIQCAMGPRWDRELRAAIEQASGKPATTAMTAVTDALEHLGARRVAVGTPFREEHNQYIRSYLELGGFEVAAIDGYPASNPRAIRALPGDAPYRIGKRVFEAAAGAEAIYLPCPIWRGPGDAIHRLEQELDVPVLTMFSPILWRALTALEYRGRVAGFGRLFAEPTV